MILQLKKNFCKLYFLNKNSSLNKVCNILFYLNIIGKSTSLIVKQFVHVQPIKKFYFVYFLLYFIVFILF